MQPFSEVILTGYLQGSPKQVPGRGFAFLMTLRVAERNVPILFEGRRATNFLKQSKDGLLIGIKGRLCMRTPQEYVINVETVTQLDARLKGSADEVNLLRMYMPLAQGEKHAHLSSDECFSIELLDSSCSGGSALVKLNDNAKNFYTQHKTNNIRSIGFSGTLLLENLKKVGSPQIEVNHLFILEISDGYLTPHFDETLVEFMKDSQAAKGGSYE